jgi:hypothetical protein
MVIILYHENGRNRQNYGENIGLSKEFRFILFLNFGIVYEFIDSLESIGNLCGKEGFFWDNKCYYWLFVWIRGKSVHNAEIGDSQIG